MSGRRRSPLWRELDLELDRMAQEGEEARRDPLRAPLRDPDPLAGIDLLLAVLAVRERIRQEERGR